MRQSRVISFYMVFRQAEQALLFLRPDEEKHRGKYLCAVFVYRKPQARPVVPKSLSDEEDIKNSFCYTKSAVGQLHEE